MRLTKTSVGAVILSVLLLGVVAAGYSRARHNLGWAGSVRIGLRTLEPAAIELMMNLPPELHESSGVAASRQNAGLLWTHNDSGNRPVVYGVQLGGPKERIVAWINLDGASAVDWEDIALGPCPWSGSSSCLYVADIGDNFRRRSSVAVIVFEEPVLNPADGKAPQVEWSEAELRYPDGAANAEGLAVTDAGDLLIVTIDPRSRGRVFKLSRDEVVEALQGKPAVLRPAGSMRTRWSGVTAAAWSGTELVVRSHTEVFRWRQEGDTWRLAGRPCFVGHAGRGGEGLDVAAPGVFYLTREDRGEDSARLNLAVCAT